MHTPPWRGWVHACMLPDLLHVQEFELPIISQRRLSQCACHRSQDSRRRRFCMYQGGTQDQDVKDVDRWMKIKQQVILVLLCALFMHIILIIPFVYHVNLHIVSSLSQKTLLATSVSIYPLSLSTSSHLYFNKR